MRMVQREVATVHDVGNWLDDLERRVHLGITQESPNTWRVPLSNSVVDYEAIVVHNPSTVDIKSYLIPPISEHSPVNHELLVLNDEINRPTKIAIDRKTNAVILKETHPTKGLTQGGFYNRLAEHNNTVEVVYPIVLEEIDKQGEKFQIGSQTLMQR